MLWTINVLTAAMAMGLAAVRLVESINELRKNPDLSTAGKCWQVVKNFFTVETYRG